MSWSNAVFVVGFIVYIWIRGRFGARTKHNKKILSRADATDRALVVLVFAGNILLPALFLSTSLLRFADYQLPAAVRLTGAVVMIFALWLFWRSHADLGLNWSITLEMRHEHQLVQTGVYRRIRHPMYAAIFLFAIAQGLLLQNWLAGWGGFVSFALLYLVRTPREERMMCEHFGEEYRDYIRKSGRLVPPIR